MGEGTNAVSDGRALSANGTSHQGSDPAPAADPRREAHAGNGSASHFSATAPPAADDATATAASAAATLAASSSPGVTVGTTDGATGNAATAARTGMDIDTDPVPATTAHPTAEHICPFLLHIRRSAADMAVDPALGAATPADAADDTPRGRKRNNASNRGPSDGDVAGGSVAVAADITVDESAVTADDDTAIIPSKKRRRSGGPARAAREAAFLASKAHDATDNPLPLT